MQDKVIPSPETIPFNGKLFTKPSHNFFYSSLICVVFLIAGLALVFIAKGTADEGDSIMHYLYARTAFKYPDHFFYQWAKPVYVLIAAPFAQFGIGGIKIFNLVVSTITVWLTYKTAKELFIPKPELAALFTVFAPMMMIVTLSGLTEPLFACWLITGLLTLIRGNKTFSVLWFSFLPFVRSEGLIVICVLVLYLLVKRYYRYLPLLLTGHVVYAVAGYPVHKDFLWVFNTLSYATLHSAYGQGPWNHFIMNLPIVISIPLCFLFAAGLFYGVYRAGKMFSSRQDRISSDNEIFLVYGICAAYFIAHSAFWALGIFNSFGLLRVMVGILPLIAIISLRGFNLLTGGFRIKWPGYVLIAIVILFPFINNVYAFKWKRDFTLKADQQAELALGNYVKKNFRDYRKYVFYYEPCYLSVSLDIDYFDTTRHKRLLNAFDQNNFPDSCFLVWDDWFAPMEGKVELQPLLDDGRFQLLQSFEEKDFWHQVRRVKLFRKVK